MRMKKKYNLTFNLTFFIGLGLLFHFLYWWIALPLSIGWFIGSFFVTQEIAYRTFDKDD